MAVSATSETSGAAVVEAGLLEGSSRGEMETPLPLPSRSAAGEGRGEMSEAAAVDVVCVCVCGEGPGELAGDAVRLGGDCAVSSAAQVFDC